MTPSLRSLLMLLLVPTLLFAVACQSSAATAQSADNTLRLNISPQGYPPFTIVHPDGSVGGIVWDLVTRVAKRHGYQVEAKQIPRKRVDDFILSGTIDMTARAVEWTSEPAKFAFTEPFLDVDEVFFKRSGTEFEYTEPEDILGHTVIAHLGYQYPRLSPLFESGQATRFDAQNEHDMFRYLASGENVKLAIAVKLVGLWHIRQEGWEGQIEAVSKPLSSQGYRLMFHKDRQDLVNLFSNEFKRMKTNGELQQILDRYR